MAVSANRPAPAKAETDRDAKGKSPFRARFKAWWEGYDLAEPAAAQAAPLSITEATHKVRYEATQQRWETTRLRLVQEVWGEGFSSPGGPEYIGKLIKFFALDPAMTVLDLGAGLGGAARTMAEDFGVWVTGLEADPHLAEAAMALSTKAGLAKRARISVFEPEHLEQKANSVDCVFSKEFFYTVKGKEELLKAIETLLKSRGQLLFIDYLLTSRHLRSEDLDKWIAGEPHGAHPWAVEDYSEAFANLHMDIRVTEDITTDFHQMVTHGWNDFARAHKHGVEEEMVPTLIDEIETWSRRTKVMECGQLKVCRFHVFKRDTRKLMSNW